MRAFGSWMGRRKVEREWSGHRRGPVGPEGGWSRQGELLRSRGGAGTATDPAAQTGPKAQAPHCALGLDAGREARLLCVCRRRFRTPRLGLDSECPSRGAPRAAAWPPPAFPP